MQCLNSSFHDDFIICLEIEEDAEIDSTKYKGEHFAPDDKPYAGKVWLLRANLEKSDGFFASNT